jgi:hypothetical protein
MKNNKTLSWLMICLVFVATACSNSETKETTSDTASNTDTTKSDPSTFSEPH